MQRRLGTQAIVACSIRRTIFGAGRKRLAMPVRQTIGFAGGPAMYLTTGPPMSGPRANKRHRAAIFQFRPHASRDDPFCIEGELTLRVPLLAS